MKMRALTIINIVITVLVFIGNFFYQSMGFNYTLKIICSSGFALMGIINMIYGSKRIEDKKVLLFMTLGLIFAFLGDVAINPNFILGVIFFALGHVFFVASYLAYRKLEKLDIILSTCLGAFSVGFILIFPYIVFNVSVLKYVVLLYAVIISIMVAKSMGNALREKRIFTRMIAVGSVLFFLSDMMLLLAWFSTIEGRWTSNVCMAAYYPALCLLAGAMVVYLNNDRAKRLARVKEMEETFDAVQEMLKTERLSVLQQEALKEKINLLKQYQESGQWMADFRYDEQGEIPSDLKRGVLSEDGLYNLLTDIDNALR